MAAGFRPPDAVEYTLKSGTNAETWAGPGYRLTLPFSPEPDFSAGQLLEARLKQGMPRGEVSVRDGEIRVHGVQPDAVVAVVAQVKELLAVAHAEAVDAMAAWDAEAPARDASAQAAAAELERVRQAAERAVRGDQD